MSFIPVEKNHIPTRQTLFYSRAGKTGDITVNWNRGYVQPHDSTEKPFYIRTMMEDHFRDSAKNLSAKPKGPTFKNSATSITQAPTFPEPTSDAPQHNSPDSPNKL